jgi:hypothetical protein
MFSGPAITLDGQVSAMPALEIYWPFNEPEFTEKGEFSHEPVLSSQAVKGVEIAQQQS